MEPCDLSYIAGQCDSILGDVPSRREKRDILLALLLLAWLSVSPAGGPSEGEGAGERAAQGPYSRGPRPSLGRMWEDCLSSEEQTVGHSLASLASSAAGRIPDLRPLLPADSVWERIPGRQLKQLLPLLDRALRGEGEARGAAALWEAIAARYPGETSPGTGRFYAPAEVVGLLTALLRPEGGTVYDKTTPRLIQFHTFINAVNPPFLGGFFYFRHCSGIGEAAVLPGRFLIFKGTL